MVGLVGDEGIISLFKPMQGSKILNEEITDRDGSLVPGFLGVYLSRARKSADYLWSWRYLFPEFRSWL